MQKIILIGLAVGLAAGVTYLLEKTTDPAGIDPNQRADITKIREKAVDEIDQHAEYRKEAKEELTPEQYRVCYLKGTEPPGSGKYNKHYEPGMYHCAVCDAPLFSSETKYDSGSGWPAFWDADDDDRLIQDTDYDLGYPRTEIRCKECGAHLGHVFDDGPPPTGQRYCINSVALEFIPQATSAQSAASDDADDSKQD